MADTQTVEATPASPEIPNPPPSSPTEATPDAALDKLFGGETKAPAPEAKAEPRAAPTQEAEPADETPKPGIDRDALTRALGALRRDNVPDAVIEHWMENHPDKLLAWADKASKRQGDIDKILSGQKPEPEAKEATEEPQAEPTGQPANDDEALADLVRPFAEEMGSERAQETLTKLARHVRASTIAAIAPEVAEMRGTLDSLRGGIQELLFREARVGLRERFPQAADDAKWKAYRDRVTLLARGGTYNEHPQETLLNDAAMLEWGNDNLRERQETVARTHKARANGTPTPPTRTRKPVPATPDQEREAVLDRIFGE